MSGIYIHIPFCASRCIYCDFYSTTLQGKAHLYVDALTQEMNERRNFLPSSDTISTVYIGGGTPSQLPAAELSRLLDNLSHIFDLSAVEEVTLEVNPEDITPEYTAQLHPLINRVSMGIQSFVDSELKILCRRHDSRQPAYAVDLLREKGIRNISIDLMYGLPDQTIESFAYSIERAIDLDTEHISAYCLSIENGTKLEKAVLDGKLNPADEETCNKMSELVREKLKDAGFIQYEISNYARQGHESKHNSSYWVCTPYLGLGPGAHSYDGLRTRSWNIPNLTQYIAGERLSEKEELSDADLYNEMVMLSLRTRQGLPINDLSARFGESHPEFISHFDRYKADLINKGFVTINNENRLTLTPTGLALGDSVIRDLIYLD